jgi:hypothetical protein
MKYANIFAAAGALVCLVGCASAPRVVVDEPLGPSPTGVAQGTGEGSMVIYSARTPADVDVYTEEWRWNNDFGKNAFLYEPAHSDYTIYTPNGEVFKHVRNARDQNDDTPTVVKLPAGSYKVEAEAVNCDANRVKVLMAVVIKPGQPTLAHLEGDWNPMGQFKDTEVAKLPCGRVIGWRASETGYAGLSPHSQSN